MNKFTLNKNQDYQSFERIMIVAYEHQREILKVHEQYLKSQADFSQKFFQLMQQQYSQLALNPVGVQAVINEPVIEKQLQIPEINGLSEQFDNTQEMLNLTSHKNSEDLIIKIPSDVETNTDSLTTETIEKIPQSDLESFTHSLLEVVSDKTGYPTEMLELEMELESDLGIDSIKRVQILGAIKELYSDLPPVNPEELAELRTLAQIIDYIAKYSPKFEKKNLIT